MLSGGTKRVTHQITSIDRLHKASQISAHSSISYAPRQWRHRIEIPAANCVSLTTPTVWELKKQSPSKSRGLCRVLSVSSIHDAVIGSR